jgi:hypothetical protein
VRRKSPCICTTLAKCEMGRSCLLTTICQVHNHGFRHGILSVLCSVLCVVTNRTRQPSVLEHPGFPFSTKSVSIDSDLCCRLLRIFTLARCDGLGPRPWLDPGCVMVSGPVWRQPWTRRGTDGSLSSPLASTGIPSWPGPGRLSSGPGSSGVQAFKSPHPSVSLPAAGWRWCSAAAGHTPIDWRY